MAVLDGPSPVEAGVRSLGASRVPRHPHSLGISSSSLGGPDCIHHLAGHFDLRDSPRLAATPSTPSLRSKTNMASGGAHGHSDCPALCPRRVQLEGEPTRVSSECRGDHSLGHRRGIHRHRRGAVRLSTLASVPGMRRATSRACSHDEMPILWTLSVGKRGEPASQVRSVALRYETLRS